MSTVLVLFVISLHHTGVVMANDFNLKGGVNPKNKKLDFEMQSGI